MEVNTYYVDKTEVFIHQQMASVKKGLLVIEMKEKIIRSHWRFMNRLKFVRSALKRITYLDSSVTPMCCVSVYGTYKHLTYFTNCLHYIVSRMFPNYGSVFD